MKHHILEVARNIVKKQHLDLNDEEKKETGVLDITASFDGSWQKRGYKSLYGIGVVIDLLTSLVIDYEILSKYCTECTAAVRDLSGDSPDFAIWYEGHKSECQINHTGSSSSMEMEAAAILWQRSIKECNMRYTCILSDGDSKTFQHLMSLNIYGKGKPIKKEECINHISKRLGTGLRSKVKEWRSKGVCIGGKKVGSLKETTIVKLTNFYRKAIKDNCNDVEKMKSAIYATLYHCSSTDAKPKHSKCPNGKLSWCFFKRALANEESPESHSVMKTKLTEEVVAKILPVYQRLASNEILSWCTSGKSQNANESLHSVIWSHCPKESFQSKKRLEISVVTAVSEFNFGSLFTLKHIHQNASLPSMQISGVRDERRLKQSRSKTFQIAKDKRNMKRKISNKIENINIKSEGLSYCAGQF
ncbi:uncharacterized protein TNCV_1942071 [Trichonephila clavipes]|uniref:Mutator-like transposase domain-containing protein n=1 Tax=Trichonephila clavipes TaxID=2585209 RepID=A0A8X6V8Z6_TRICX|nr:uncharacterized protein TNCV_1942071 [Trichonephila clavipes]